MARASARRSEFHEVDTGRVEIRWDGPFATLLLDGVESSCLDTADPTVLEFEYMQHATCALDAVIPEGAPVRAVHLGAAGCALPLAWSRLRPESRQTAVEVDAALAAGVREWFDLPRAPRLAIRVGDGRAVLESLRDGSADVVVRDAFASGVVPSHMATREFAEVARAKLKPGGLLLLNSAHGGGADARAEIATISSVFEDVCSIQDPKVGRSGRRGNVLVVAHDGPRGSYPVNELDRRLRRLPLPARTTSGDALRRWCAGAPVLRDPRIDEGEAAAPDGAE